MRRIIFTLRCYYCEQDFILGAVVPDAEAEKTKRRLTDLSQEEIVYFGSFACPDITPSQPHHFRILSVTDEDFLK